MKLKSNGCKPLITGKYKTRRDLIQGVVCRYGKMSQERIGEECGVSQYVVCRILQDATACGKIKPKYAGAGI